MGSRINGYWTLTWIGLLANVAALPLIALVAFAGPPLQVANISLAISFVWPTAIVGIVGAAGLLAERNWGVILTIIALSMSLTVSLPYGITRLVLVKDLLGVSGLSLLISILNLLALIYWCKPKHRKMRRL